MTERRPRDTRPRGEEHHRGVLERVGAGQHGIRGKTHVVHRDVRLVDAAQRHLPGDDGARVARGVLLDEEAAHVAVVVAALVVDAGPDEGDAAGGAVADPLLGAAERPSLGGAGGRGLERDGVGAVVGFGEGEGAEHGAVGEGLQPPLLLLGRAVERQRPQRQAALHRQRGGEGAVVARDLHVDQAGRQGRGVRELGVLDAVGEQLELAHALHEVDRVGRGIPLALHARADLVGERLGGVPDRAVGIGDVGEHRVVVGVAAVEEVVVGDALAGQRTGIGIDGHGSQYRASRYSVSRRGESLAANARTRPAYALMLDRGAAATREEHPRHPVCRVLASGCSGR